MFPFGFDGFSILFTLVFLLIFILVLATAVRSFSQWHKNNRAPRLTVEAAVVAKRNHVFHHNQGTHLSTSATYYVTFEVASGDRMELPVPSSEFGYLVEGDHGLLTFQGTRFLSFERSAPC